MRKITRFLNRRVIVDDGCPASGGVYTTYLFGEGAFAKGEGSAPKPVETDRDSLGGNDILIHRRHFVLHPRGIKWTNTTVADSSPTNIEAEDSTNWNRVYELKSIRLIKFIHKIG